MTVGIQDRAQVGQSDVEDEPGDRVEHDGNTCLLRVCLDVMDTFLHELVRSLFVLCYVILVHPLLHVHTSHGEGSTEYLNEDPSRVPVPSPLGSPRKAW